MANYAELKTAVKALTGTAALSLTIDQAKALKVKKPKAFAAYQKLRKEYINDWKAILQSVGSKLVPYEKVRAKLKAAGFTDVLSEGFEGFIDSAGKMYTTTKELLNGAPRFAFYPKIKMNPNYGTKGGDNWVCQGIKVDGSPGGYFYTGQFSHTQHVQKHKKVGQLDLPAVRKRWLPKVKKFSITDPDSVASVILEMLWQFTARIGTPGNSTFGLSTLQVRHAAIAPTGIVLRYKGKDEVSTVHKLLAANIEHRPLIAAIKLMMADKGPKDNLFSFDRNDGKKIKIQAVYTNRYWHKLGVPAEVTVHKIRTWRGTNIFNTEIDKILADPPKTLAEAKRAYAKAAEAVGAALNHVRHTEKGTKITGATALNSYVDVEAQIRYWQTLGYPLSPKLAKFV